MVDKKILMISVFPPLLTCLLSCTINSVNTEIIKKDKEPVFQKNQTANTAKIKLNINTRNFSTKASSSGQANKTQNDVLSYTAYLTTNTLNPFTTGITQTVSKGEGSTTVTFLNVPAGGPYFAAVAAFDSLSGSGNNITQPQPELSSSDKRWAISGNSVSVDSAGNLSFSNEGNQLNVSVQLQHGISPQIDTQITPNNGTGMGALTVSMYPG